MATDRTPDQALADVHRHFCAPRFDSTRHDDACEALTEHVQKLREWVSGAESVIAALVRRLDGSVTLTSDEIREASQRWQLDATGGTGKSRTWRVTPQTGQRRPR